MAGRLNLLLLALMALGCSYAKGLPYIVDGEQFPDAKVASIREGMSAAEVLQILGKPYEIESSEYGERWRYYVWQQQDETIRYLFIPVRKPLYSGTKEATILLRNGRVKEVGFEHKRFD